jgi:hypothetical protein
MSERYKQNLYYLLLLVYFTIKIASAWNNYFFFYLLLLPSYYYYPNPNYICFFCNYSHHRNCSTTTKLISTNPNVAIINTVSIDINKPDLTKSWTFKYGLWKSSTTNNEFTFGNDENGSAIAADTFYFIWLKLY